MAAPEQSAAKTYDAVQNPRPEAIVVYCGDPRFQVAFVHLGKQGVPVAIHQPVHQPEPVVQSGESVQIR